MKIRFESKIFSLVAISLVLSGCGATDGKPANAVSGTVTLADKPVRYATLIATGPGGEKRMGTTDEDGRYWIVNPPEGDLTINLIKVPAPAPPRPNPPPPPGVKYLIPPPIDEPKPPQAATPIPEKYFNEDGFSLRYSGGRQSFDIELTR